MAHPHNVHIGHNALIAAGSVATKDAEPYATAAGKPAKKLGCRRTLQKEMVAIEHRVGKRMKVAVITRHAITNYGSLLQAFATQKAVESLGHSCEIIDYIRDDESCTQHEKTLLKQKPAWNCNPLKKAIYLALRQPESIAAGKRFEKERSQYLNLTRKYTNHEQLLHDKPLADVYMTGSDQVWGPVENGTYDSAYCLSFTGEEEKRIAYAASFGRTEMSDSTAKFFEKWLSRYRHIGVREDSAVGLLNEMCIDSVQVLDPTLLLDAAFWSAMAKPIQEKKYVLIYQLHNDERLGAYASRVAKSLGLPLIRVSASFHQINREGKLIWCPSMGEFLSYIKNAACLITDSFHGTAFAINFNTAFVEVLPNNKTGTRNVSILKMTGLSDRILREDGNTRLAEQKIDYARVNHVLAEKRKESLELLRNMIEY